MELVPGSTRARPAARWPARRSSAPPALHDYASRLWDYGERDMEPSMSAARTLREALDGKHVMITRAALVGDRAIDRAKGRRAGGVPLLVARTVETLEEARAEIVRRRRHGVRLRGRHRRHGLGRHARPSASSPTTSQRRQLVNNAGARSADRSRSATTASIRLRAHDAAHYLLRRRQADHRSAPRTCAPSGSGHIVKHLVDRRPDQPAALLGAIRRVEGGARRVHARRRVEVIGDGVTFTTIHMPLVRTR